MVKEATTRSIKTVKAVDAKKYASAKSKTDFGFGFRFLVFGRFLCVVGENEKMKSGK
jgi:hypothetical protein